MFSQGVDVRNDALASLGKRIAAPPTTYTPVARSAPPEVLAGGSTHLEERA